MLYGHPSGLHPPLALPIHRVVAQPCRLQTLTQQGIHGFLHRWAVTPMPIGLPSQVQAHEQVGITTGLLCPSHGIQGAIAKIVFAVNRRHEGCGIGQQHPHVGRIDPMRSCRVAWLLCFLCFLLHTRHALGLHVRDVGLLVRQGGATMGHTPLTQVLCHRHHCAMGWQTGAQVVRQSDR
jgi:hypothetical protein